MTPWRRKTSVLKKEIAQAVFDAENFAKFTGQHPFLEVQRLGKGKQILTVYRGKECIKSCAN